MSDERATTEHRDAAKIAITGLDNFSLREIVKSAIKELIREQAQEFGWWTAKTATVAILGAVILFVLYVNGWVHKP